MCAFRGCVTALGRRLNATYQYGAGLPAQTVLYQVSCSLSYLLTDVYLLFAKINVILVSQIVVPKILTSHGLGLFQQPISFRRSERLGLSMKVLPSTQQSGHGPRHFLFCRRWGFVSIRLIILFSPQPQDWSTKVTYRKGFEQNPNSEV